MNTFVIMADRLDPKKEAVTVRDENTYLIKKYKKKGYAIVGRAKVHKEFKVTGVSIR